MNFWEWMVFWFIFFPVIAFIAIMYLYYCWPLVLAFIIGVMVINSKNKPKKEIEETTYYPEDNFDLRGI